MDLYVSTKLSLSDFKISKICAALEQHLKITLVNFKIVDCYLIKSTSAHDALLFTLLGTSTLFNQEAAADCFFIGPRIGVKSSWSSKTTDLVQSVGYSTIAQVEKIKLISWDNTKTHKQYEDTESLKTRIIETIHSQADTFKMAFDPLLESVYSDIADIQVIPNAERKQALVKCYDLSGIDGYQKLESLNQAMGLSLSEQELDYLVTFSTETKHIFTDAELMMFAQANSEHCRHKVFNATWIIDEIAQNKTLFGMIKNTHINNPINTVKAYKDNGAIINGFMTNKIWPDNHSQYQTHHEYSHIVIKVETHNHPTAIAPFPGAATGSGGEIRDEGATGRGAQPKASLTGFSVSDLNIPNHAKKWEINLPPPYGTQSAFNIMQDGPLGAARYNNEFGRPNICGYFRSFLYKTNDHYYGYHKPIMLSGGLGSIRSKYTEKLKFNTDCLVIVLGGPAILIGLGGGAISSRAADLHNNKLDYASVQRENPEMQRRCQEVINHCWRSDSNPILSIHDVGAGGLSNAIPEIVYESLCGATLDLAKIPCDELTMSPMELWCNEAQERYVLIVNQESLSMFEDFCRRENCPYAVLGKTTAGDLILRHDEQNVVKPIDLPLEILFGNAPKVIKKIQSSSISQTNSVSNAVAIYNLLELSSAFKDVLAHPTVASKQYLITIGDRSVGGLVARDQMVGKYQVPVADCGVTLSDFVNLHGEAMAIGERTPLAILNHKAAARLAVAEAICNILSADITKLEDIKLSANWMVASGDNQEDWKLYESVKAIGEDFCPKLGLSIPVGKDSMSMKTKWQQTVNENNSVVEVKAPVSLIISAFAPVNNVKNTITPELKINYETELWLIEPSRNSNNLSGSIFSQVMSKFIVDNSETIDIEPEEFKAFIISIFELKKQNLLLAYHDRSDGGLWTALVEMSFAGQVGLNLNVDIVDNSSIYKFLFNEAIGVVVQIKAEDTYKAKFKEILDRYNLLSSSRCVATLNASNKININLHEQELHSFDLKDLQKIWCETSYQMQRLRDNPQTADEELLSINNNTTMLNVDFDYENCKIFNINHNIKPKAAILREQGTNGHVEMAAALMRAGFDCVDVHMNDVVYLGKTLQEFKFLAVCGGFSYGDVLGAGVGWASRILYNDAVKSVFFDYFNRLDTLTLGVCNGCQMLSKLKALIPGSDSWPEFLVNTSEQFEARLSLVKINQSKSLLLKNLENSILPAVVSHGEGRVSFANCNDFNGLKDYQQISMQFVNESRVATELYPANPNGSPQGITGLCSTDGRVTIMMPHPERIFRTAQLSWCPEQWLEYEDSPWMQMFYSALADFA